MRPTHDQPLSVKDMMEVDAAAKKMETGQERAQRIAVDHTLRVQCVEYAIRSAAATPTVTPDQNVATTAGEIYDFITSWDIKRFEDQK